MDLLRKKFLGARPAVVRTHPRWRHSLRSHTRSQVDMLATRPSTFRKRKSIQRSTSCALTTNQHKIRVPEYQTSDILRKVMRIAARLKSCLKSSAVQNLAAPQGHAKLASICASGQVAPQEFTSACLDSTLTKNGKCAAPHTMFKTTATHASHKTAPHRSCDVATRVRNAPPQRGRTTLRRNKARLANLRKGKLYAAPHIGRSQRSKRAKLKVVRIRH
jgi:hypothetical protein